MLFRCMAIIANVIVYSKDAWESFCDVVHMHLEDVLAHL